MVEGTQIYTTQKQTLREHPDIGAGLEPTSPFGANQK
jgi:hypothetical protein